MIKIKKFEFIDLSTKIIPEQIYEITEINDTSAEKELETFADQNSLEDLGQTLEPLKEMNFISITKEEFDRAISEAKETAITQYISSQPVIIEDNNDTVLLNNVLLNTISRLVEEVKNRVDLEFEGVLEKLLQLSYVISAKVIDIHLINISQEDYITIIKSKIQELGFHNGIKIEVKNHDLAQALISNGIEVSINDDMLEADYKIIWCNGFLERKASDIVAQIEDILIEHIKK